MNHDQPINLEVSAVTASVKNKIKIMGEYNNNRRYVGARSGRLPGLFLACRAGDKWGLNALSEIARDKDLKAQGAVSGAFAAPGCPNTANFSCSSCKKDLEVAFRK
jgi:hypothetical protein